eukprot:Plantae.Rhodophyta-Purpureofilum_apyrenoidigerum.ctg8480.p1 GENE.Plantae.Rhodophyta-Purpureofilum_apyrenoidigerum.ctg8480~~Plantae.Rhodophyta-Purpureofilum_apyrenoidigerum.ctg8480.p1  ORF type:complete len:257 (-),score=48.61 Plantae.Rhodophyta-Purpureofilum_apyrenoidigerum.ctg8480:126-896(-)
MYNLGFVGSGAGLSVHSNARVVCSLKQEDGGISRRVFLSSVAAGLLTAAATPVAADPVSGRSVVNGVLSAYGLPQIPDKSGFTPVLEQYGKDKIVEFIYPSSWLVVKEQAGIDRPRLDLDRIFPTITIGDYRKAEGLAFYSTPANGKGTFDIPMDKLAKIAIQLPNPDYKVMKDTKIDKNGYRLTTFNFETNTTSGFNAERRSIAVSTVLDDTLFVLSSTCNVLRYKKIEPMVMASIENFKVTKVNKKVDISKAAS